MAKFEAFGVSTQEYSFLHDLAKCMSKSIETSQGKPLQSLVLITRCTDGLLVQTLK